VDYRDVGAVAACVCFEHWDDGKLVLESAIEIRYVKPYELGRFYHRELPCILAVLQTLSTLPLVVITDGYVWLGEQQRGLGAHVADPTPESLTQLRYRASIYRISGGGCMAGRAHSRS
jgi:deoxyribonuclease V